MKLVDAIERLQWDKPEYFRFAQRRRLDHLKIERPSMLITDTYADVPLAELTAPEQMKETEDFWIDRYNMLLGMEGFFRSSDSFSVVVGNLTAEMKLSKRQIARFFPASRLSRKDDTPIYFAFVMQGMMLSGFTVEKLSGDSFVMRSGDDTFGVDSRRVIGTNINLGPFNYKSAVDGTLWPAGYTKHVGAINAWRNAKQAKDQVAMELIKGAVWNLLAYYLDRLFPEKGV